MSGTRRAEMVVLMERSARGQESGRGRGRSSTACWWRFSRSTRAGRGRAGSGEDARGQDARRGDQRHFQRIQFTPDLLPADLIGTQIYNPKDGKFTTAHGPVFANLILADEINRAPAKVQSALLEAMQERQVTIAEQTLQGAAIRSW